MRRFFNDIRIVCIGAALAASTSAVAGLKLEPSVKVSAEERYDDDARAGLPDQLQTLTGQLMSKVTPQIGILAGDHTTAVNTWYAADFVYRHGSGNFSLDHRGMLAVKKLLTQRLTLESELRLWRVSDPTSLPRLGMARAFAPVLYGKADGGISYRATERLTLKGGYRFEGAKIYDATTGGVGVTHTPYAEGWYRLTRRLDLGADYRLQLFLFEQETALAHGTSAAARYRLTRHINMTARAGPTFYRSATTGTFEVLPRLQFELAREGEGLLVALLAGHDLVGASGFTSALWADYGSLLTEWHPAKPWRLFAAASLYANGRAPDVGWLNRDSTAVSTGYAVGGGVEWQLHRMLSLQLSFERYAQLGALERADAAAQLERNIASLRLNFRAL